MNSGSTTKYAFILGRERELCLAELKAALGYFGFDFGNLIVSDNVVFINADQAVSRLINVLGGTIKIYEIVSPMTDKIGPTLKDYIQNHPKKEGKFNFALSSYTDKFDQRRLNSLGLEIKKDFKGKLSSRFVQLREGKEVSSILTQKNELVQEGFEFGLFNESIGILVATTDPEEWGKRDYGKPAGDKYSGMLPPKLARMMVNLALGQANLRSEARNPKQIQNSNLKNSKLVSDFGIRYSNLSQRPLVVDPFCGSGNILLEALMLGYDVFGSDKSEKTIKDSQANVSWLKSEFLNPKSEANPKFKVPKSQIVQADAINDDFIRNLELEMRNYNHSVVVTEPYLGEPKKFKPSMNAVRGEYHKIKDLYLRFLKNIAKLLCGCIAEGPKNNITINNKQLTICLVFPLVETLEGKRFSLFAESVDEIKKIGYTLLRPPLIYGRDYQVVKREIVLLKF